jgi:hypothetical protein
MNKNERMREAEKKAKEAAKELFKKKPKDIQDELEKEAALGSPSNLIKPDNKDE